LEEITKGLETNKAYAGDNEVHERKELQYERLPLSRIVRTKVDRDGVPISIIFPLVRAARVAWTFALPAI
jgi:hypothetical protein